jgi:hypothetical protein
MIKINVKVDEIIDEYDYLIFGKFLLIKFKFFFYFNNIFLRFYFLKYLTDGLIQLVL